MQTTLFKNYLSFNDMSDAHFPTPPLHFLNRALDNDRTEFPWIIRVYFLLTSSDTFLPQSAVLPQSIVTITHTHTL